MKATARIRELRKQCPAISNDTINRREKTMKPSVVLQVHREKARSIILNHRVRNARVFGSALHGDDTDDSDLDVLVDPTPETTLMDIGAIRYELRKLLGIPVDVVTPLALPANIRDSVIKEAEPI